MTFSLIGVTAIIFVLQLAIPNLTSKGLKLSDKIRNGQELYRLVTPVFLHGNLQHIFTNMLSLMRMGGNVENLFGSFRYFGTYMVAGIAGNVFSVIFSPTPSLGASGAVFGIIGAYAVYLTRNRWILGPQGKKVNTNVVQTMLFNLVTGFFQKSIDQWAHLGGALGGAVMAYFLGPRLYLTETPKGKNAVIDRPYWRAPQAVETVPSKVSLKCKQLTSGVLQRPAPNRSESTRTLITEEVDPPPNLELPSA